MWSPWTIPARTQEITSTLSSSHTTLSLLLAAYSDLRTERRLLEVLLGIDERIARVEGLLGVRGGGGGGVGINGGEEVNDEDEDWSESESESESGSESVNDRRDADAGHAKQSTNGVTRVRIMTTTAPPPSQGHTALAPAPDPKMIARIASEYTQLRWLVDQARAEGCAYVVAVDEVRGAMTATTVRPASFLKSTTTPQRMHTIRTTLHARLAALLRETLRSLPDEGRPSPTSASSTSGGTVRGRSSERTRRADEAREQLRECLKVYDAVEGWREAEDVVREFIRDDLEEVSGVHRGAGDAAQC